MLGLVFLVPIALAVLGFVMAAGELLPDTPSERSTSLPLPEGVSEAELCSKATFGEPCWAEFANQPGCYFHAKARSSNAYFRWDGPCANGLGEGTGNLFEHRRAHLFSIPLLRFRQAEKGLLVKGRRHGYWTVRTSSGLTEEANYKDGLRHGVRVLRFANGETTEMRYLLGKQSGRDINRGPDGELRDESIIEAFREERVLSDYKHGWQEVLDAEGYSTEIYFVEGMPLQAWGLSEAEPQLLESPFPKSGLTGNYLLHFVNGGEGEGPYVDGKMHGEWIFRSPNGAFSRGRYVDNARFGNWIETHPDGTVAEGPYRAGRRHGDWVFRHADNSVLEGVYTYGDRTGNWVTTFANGIVAEGPYQGERAHGDWVYR